MNRKAGNLHTLRRKGAAHCLRAALALPAAALLLYSCDPPASPPPASREISRVETKKDGSTVTTTPTAEGGELVVTKDPDGREVSRLETRSDKSTITTKTTAGGITKELVIHPSVTAIEDKAFENSGLTSLTIGNGVRRIGNAFANNPQLKTVTIAGTGPVKRNSFRGIFSRSGSSGIELTIQDGITAIADYAFAGNQLTSVSIPPSVTAIGDYAFFSTQLTSLTIGNSVKTIGAEAFALNQLTSLTIPPSVTKVGRGAFYDNLLTKLTIPPSVTAIGDYAFADNQLTRVTLSKALYDARGDAFDANSPGLRFSDHGGRDLGTN